MVLIRDFFFLLFSCLIFDVSCSKKLCDFNDSECLSAAAQRVNVFSTARPLHVDLLEAELPTLKYTLRNATLFGLNTCISELVRINGFKTNKNLTYDYIISCKRLVIEGLYEINGELGPEHIEGKGPFKIVYDDYAFLLNGDLGQYFDKNGKLHNHMENFKLDMDARGNIEYQIENLFDGDTEKAAPVKKYIRENGHAINKVLRQPGMEKFIKVLFDRANAYLEKTPVEDLFTEA